MAVNILHELDQQLASLNQLKPPGASKGKIGSITALCVSNIQAESNIVQSLYRALKKAPATHKLGALYVIDSVVRQWIEAAKRNGQELNIEGRGEPGTYNAAVKRVTELIPALFDDILKGLPADQKPKLENLLGIWEKGNIFPAKLLSEFRTKLSGAPQAPPQTAQVSSGGKFMAPVPSRPAGTPVGYPPQHLYAQGLIVRPGEQPPQANGMSAQQSRPPPQPQQQPQVQAALPPAPAPPTQDVNSILAALAQAAPPPTAPTPSQPPPQPFMPQPQSQPQTPAATQQQQLPPGLAALFGQQSSAQPPAPQAPQQAPQFSAPPANPPQMPMPPNFPAFPGFQGFPPQQPPQPPPSVPQTYAMAPPPPAPQPPADPLAPLRSILPANILGDQQKLVMALNLLQDLQKQGLPMDQWGPILKAFDESQPSAPQSNGHEQYGRRRSRSPDRGDRRGRASPVYGTYEEIAAKDQAQADRSHRGGGGGRGKYRQRSPLSNMRNLQMRDSPGPAMMNGTMMQPKYIAIDSSLPPDHIKVLSRTLFVGGANGTQQEIQALFERFGRVQTCIANREKRHAFVKMTTRNNALAAKAGMEELQQRNDREVMAVARQTKWGVGFGPRECCDYTRGESVIPIYKLTDADNKWLLTAEYGGTGGKQLESGMVLEEPDIEIGAGVSSKAMSKRVMPDAGPPSKRQREEEGGGGHHHGGGGGRGHGHGHGGGKKGKRHHQHDYDAQPAQNYGGYSGVTGGAPMPMEAYRYARPEPVAVATPPAVPTFGFSLPGQGGPPYQ